MCALQIALACAQLVQGRLSTSSSTDTGGHLFSMLFGLFEPPMLSPAAGMQFSLEVLNQYSQCHGIEALLTSLCIAHSAMSWTGIKAQGSSASLCDANCLLWSERSIIFTPAHAYKPVYFQTSDLHIRQMSLGKEDHVAWHSDVHRRCLTGVMPHEIVLSLAFRSRPRGESHSTQGLRLACRVNTVSLEG